MHTSSMSPGMLLGERYRLEDLLSEHETARFWRATDVVLARSVAVHVVPSDDPRAAAIMEAARLSARVVDPHLLRVLDADDTGGLTWVVNEWGEGDSLDVMLEQGPLPPARAAWLAREVGEALVAAHAKDVAHGRLNPEAVLVTRTGSVKLIGFAVYAALAGPTPTSPTYGGLDPREADVIDLAGILYAALTGRWPGVSPSAVPVAPLEGRRPLRPRQVVAGIPRTLDAVCDRVLNKEASQHAAPIETALEIAAALNDHLGDPAKAAPVDLPAMHLDPEAEEPPTAHEPVVPTAPEVPPVPAHLQAQITGPAPAETPDVEPVETPATDSAPEAPPDVVPHPDEFDVQGPDPEATMAALPPDQTMPHAFAGLDVRDFHDLEEWDPAPPPPPFEAKPDRPLFADHERRVPEATEPLPGPQAPPSGWPFDDAPGPVTTAAPVRRRRRWLRALGWTVAVVVVIAALGAAAYVGFGLGDDDPSARPSGDPTSSPSADGTPAPIGTPLKVFLATDFDPEGDPPEENPEQAGNAVDGNPATTWQTLTYKGDARLGGLKSGVGVLLDLGSEVQVGSVQLQLVGAPTSMEFWATAPGVDDTPAELADLTRVGSLATDGTDAVARFDPTVRTRYLLVWLTKVPAADGGFRGEIAEVTVRP